MGHTVEHVLTALITLVAAAGAAVTTAPAARADDESFLQVLHTEGASATAADDDALLALGHSICSRLRDGAAKTEIITDITVGSHGMPRMLPPYPARIVEIAQTELCLDTLDGDPGVRHR